MQFPYFSTVSSASRCRRNASSFSSSASAHFCRSRSFRSRSRARHNANSCSGSTLSASSTPSNSSLATSRDSIWCWRSALEIANSWAELAEVDLSGLTRDFLRKMGRTRSSLASSRLDDPELSELLFSLEDSLMSRFRKYKAAGDIETTPVHHTIGSSPRPTTARQKCCHSDGE